MQKRFYRSLLILGIITSLIILAIQFSSFSHLLNPYVWYLQAYLFIITAVTFFITNKGVKDNLMDFQNFVMAGIGIRFFLSAIIIFLYIYLVKHQSFTFLGNFFVLYLFYTVFEIQSVLSNLRAHLKKDASK
jgi:hypothetical protein